MSEEEILNTGLNAEEVSEDTETTATDNIAPVVEPEKEPETRGEWNRLYAENRILKKSINNQSDDVEPVAPVAPVTPDIRQVVREELQYVAGDLRKSQDEQEIRDFMGQHPELKDYEAKARKIWSHESRRHLPFRTVMLETAGDDLYKIGAKQALSAKEEAGKYNVSGRTSRQIDTKQDFSKMSNEEFAKFKNSFR